MKLPLIAKPYPDSTSGTLDIWDAEGVLVNDFVEPDAAKYIVAAVNSHEALVKACEALLRREIEVIGFSGSPFTVDEVLVREVRATLALAKEQS